MFRHVRKINIFWLWWTLNIGYIIVYSAMGWDNMGSLWGILIFHGKCLMGWALFSIGCPDFFMSALAWSYALLIDLANSSNGSSIMGGCLGPGGYKVRNSEKITIGCGLNSLVGFMWWIIRHSPLPTVSCYLCIWCSESGDIITQGRTNNIGNMVCAQPVSLGDWKGHKKERPRINGFKGDRNTDI